MAKGNIAKEKVTKIIADAFGADYIGEFEKKLYVWADDGGNRVQVSIALTCPKVYRGVEETATTEMNFDDDVDTSAAVDKETFKPADITQEEQDTLAALMAKLGL